MRPYGKLDGFPIPTYDMESNIFIQDIYDFGILVGMITIIWILHSTFYKMKDQRNYNYITSLSWFGLLIASLSNVQHTFPILLVPVCLYSWEKYKILKTKFDFPVVQN